MTAARRTPPAASPCRRGTALATARTAALAAVLALVPLVAGACVGGPSTPRAEMLTPFPDGRQVVVDVTEDCRDGESGFGYRFLVVDDPDIGSGGELVAHIRSRNFYRTARIAVDLPWVDAGFQHREHPVRATIGPLADYLDDPRPHQGPRVEDIPDEVRADPTGYTLIALRPTDFSCETPL